MEWIPMTETEKLFLRSRMATGLGLGLACLGVATIGAFYFIDNPTNQYLWFSLTFLAMVGALGFLRIGWRFYKDVRFGNKRIEQLNFKRVSQDPQGRSVIQIKGRKFKVPQDVGHSSEQVVAVHQTGSGYVLDFKMAAHSPSSMDSL